MYSYINIARWSGGDWYFTTHGEDWKMEPSKLQGPDRKTTRLFAWVFLICGLYMLACPSMNVGDTRDHDWFIYMFGVVGLIAAALAFWSSQEQNDE